MKTTKSIAAYAMLLGTLLATNLVQTAHADPLDKSSPKIAHRMRFHDTGFNSVGFDTGRMRKNVVRTRNAGPIGITISNIEEDAGMYRDRGKSSPKIAHGMRKNVLRHEIELAFQRGDFGLAFELIHELDQLDGAGFQTGDVDFN